MNYQRQEFIDGKTTLRAQHLINMEDAILENEANIKLLASGSSNADPLYGLNVLCLGDSITAGQGMTSTTRWANVLGNKHNWNLTVQAQGGISLSSYWYTANNSTDVSINKKAETIATMNPKPDLVIVWGGHNDASYRYAPLGSFEDLASTDSSGMLSTKADKNSFKGALRYIAELVHTYAPKATLVVLTREWTSLTPSSLKVPEGTTDTNRMFDDAVYEGAKYFGWVPINMQLCGITPFTLTTYTGDRVHPNALGTALIVNYLSSELSKIYRIQDIDSIKVTGVTLNKTSTSLKVGNTETLSATITPSDATTKTVTWSSSNTSVATVSSGKITAIAAGQTIITVTTTDGGFKATCTVKVNAEDIKVTGISLDKHNYTMEQSTQMRLNATIVPSDATNQNLIWTSSNEDTLTVEAGLVKALREGSAIVTVKTEDGEYTDTCEFTITAENDYWLLERLNGVTHNEVVSNSMLGTQYFAYDGEESLNQLQGKTINGIWFMSRTGVDSVPTTNVNIYLVNLNNLEPANWELKQTVTMQNVSPGDKVSFDLEEIYIPEGYTIGVKASTTYVGSQKGFDTTLPAHYWAGTTGSGTAISSGAYDFRIKV